MNTEINRNLTIEGVREEEMIVENILSDLIKLYNSVGYLTTEDILMVSDRENLLLEEVDLLFDRITSYGIIILDEAPETIDESSIPIQKVAITITQGGYIIRIPLSSYNRQRRGGRGMSMIAMQEKDYVDHMYTASSHNYLLFFTNRGKMHIMKAYEIPESSRLGKGTPINKLLLLEPNETISHMIPIESMALDEIQGKYLVFATRQGIVKKTALADYKNIRKMGIIAIVLRDDDDLLSVCLSDGDQEIILVTHKGMSIRFSEADVRAMGRDTTGVIGIQLGENDWVIGMDIVRNDSSILVITTRGYGKRTSIHDYRKQVRGGKGYANLNCTMRIGWAIGLQVVNEEDEIIIITNAGVTLRTSVTEVTEMGRNTQGVRLIDVPEREEVVTISRVTPKQN